ncbi:MAG: hypothetical protein EP343_16170 [Deltaproteobacteria bacterium]|nr:MAG: hypothetical protein EP343_16170 [Deltaproteobacteria bacterium]
MKRSLFLNFVLLLCFSILFLACTPQPQSLGQSGTFFGNQSPHKTSSQDGLGTIQQGVTTAYYGFDLPNPPPPTFPAHVQQAITATNFPIHTGNSPKRVTGLWKVTLTITDNNNAGIGQGAVLIEGMSFWGQKNGKIKLVNHFSSDPGQGYTSGSGSNFTIYTVVNVYNSTCRYYTLFSGTRTGKKVSGEIIRILDPACGPSGWLKADMEWERLGKAVKTTEIPQSVLQSLQ